jgi:hypothetical protein
MIRFLTCSIFLTLLGCGAADDGRKDVYPVSGKITLNGAPLAGASVAYAPQEQGNPTAIGKTDNEGVYNLTTYEALDGAAPGKYAVVVTKMVSTTPEEVEGADAAHEAESAGVEDGGGHDAETADAASGNLVPANYGSASSTPLSATVEEKDDNVFDFDIQ